MKKVFLIFFLLYFSGTLLAQQDTLKKEAFVASASRPKSLPVLWWLTLGYGGSTVTDGDIGSGLGAMMTVNYGLHFISARVVHDEGSDLHSPSESIFDYGILYGIGTHESSWFGYASVGLAHTSTTKRIFVRQDTIQTFPQNIYRAELYSGIGLAWQVQFFSTFSESSNIGLGATICGNVNKSFSYWMLLLSLELGKFN